MTDYTSPEFLTTPQGSDAYDDLDWHNKIKIKALEGLDQLAANLNAIANIKAIEFQINHLNSMTSGFTDQLSAKDNEIASLQTQLNAIDHANEAQLTALQQQIAGLQEANATLTANFDKLKSVLTSIDQMTDEVIS
jgi:chromosome segregation ATPase|tara:strand:- start:180 stop:587 length:408 start_codon:yes stop_codon:yes gene_type:complete